MTEVRPTKRIKSVLKEDAGKFAHQQNQFSKSIHHGLIKKVKITSASEVADKIVGGKKDNYVGIVRGKQVIPVLSNATFFHFCMTMI